MLKKNCLLAKFDLIQIVRLFNFDFQKARLKFDLQICLMNQITMLQRLKCYLLILPNYRILMIKCFIMANQKLNQFTRRDSLNFMMELHFGYYQKFQYFVVFPQKEMLLRKLRFLQKLKKRHQILNLQHLRIIQIPKLLNYLKINLLLHQKVLLYYLDLELLQILMIMIVYYFIQTLFFIND